MQQLNVWAERIEGFIKVGQLSFEPEAGERFIYDEDYLLRDDACPIYPVLPLGREMFDATRTRSAFFSLGPEGRVGHDIRTALRAGRDSMMPVLSRLNCETVGALTFFAADAAPDYIEAAGREADLDFLRAFAKEPERLSYDTMLMSRLSLNGSVSKIGLARDGDAWLIPTGLAPTTHILKAGSTSYPNQMLNEAICMRCARACGFEDAAETALVVLDGCDPLLVSKRFDRTEDIDRPRGMPRSMRLHQADFCQLMGISVDSLKYTPSDELVEGYNSAIAKTIAEESSQRYGDRLYIFDAQVFNFLIGNCDNHLKNYSMTWLPNWKSKTVSPLYDVTCTTIYQELSRDMGLGIGRHRSIDDIDVEDFRILASQLAIGEPQARQSLEDLSNGFEAGLMAAAQQLEDAYGVAATGLARRMRDEGKNRIVLVEKAASIL